MTTISKSCTAQRSPCKNIFKIKSFMQRTNQPRMNQSRNCLKQEDVSEVVNMRFQHNQLELEVVHKDNSKTWESFMNLQHCQPKVWEYWTGKFLQQKREEFLANPKLFMERRAQIMELDNEGDFDQNEQWSSTDVPVKPTKVSQKRQKAKGKLNGRK